MTTNKITTLACFALLAASATGAQGVDRSKPPALGPAPTLKLPPAVVRELPNGLKLMIVERHKLPIADFVLVVPAGAAANPAEKAGIADIASTMLTAGTSTRTALQIDDQIGFLGISLGAGSGWDATTVSLTTPTAVLDSALALFADVALRPSFPEAEFARVKQQRLTSLLQLRDRGPAIANRVYPAIIFGADHPYGRPSAGTEASVGGMTASDVSAFYRTNYVPNGATIIAVGDVTPDQVEQKMRALFGGWARGTGATATVGAAPAPAPTAIYLVDKPGAAQSSFRIGSVGVARSTPEYFPLLVMNTLLGGSFSSRLNQDLREVKGYTYGAGSRFDMRRAAGPFTASAEIVSAKSDSSLMEFMSQLKAIREPVPAAELSRTKRYIELTLPSSFETTGQVAARLADVALYGLPLDYYNNYVSNVEAVTPADVQRVAQEHIDPSHLTIVIVGDRKTIQAPIEALHLAPLSIRDMNGNPVQR